MGAQLNLRIDSARRLSAESTLLMPTLSVSWMIWRWQVGGQIDRVEVRQMQFTDTRRRARYRQPVRRDHRGRRSDATVLELQLAVDVVCLQQNLPAVAQQFLIVQHGRRPG